jgi:hypothetical protein
MSAKNPGDVFSVQTSCLKPDVLRVWREHLPQHKRSSEVVNVTLIRLKAGTRSYECRVEGIPPLLSCRPRVWAPPRARQGTSPGPDPQKAV